MKGMRKTYALPAVVSGLVDQALIMGTPELSAISATGNSVAAGLGADDGYHIVLVNQLAGRADGRFGLVFVIFNDQADLHFLITNLNAAGVVDFLHGQFGCINRRLAGGGDIRP